MASYAPRRFNLFPLRSSAEGRVALLGIAQRQIRIKYAHNLRNQQQPKPLPTSIMTVGDWIQVKRCGKNLTPSHLATKMGIAPALIYSWEADTSQPDIHQMKLLEVVLGFNANDFDARTSNL
jgi:ribosome-binding protein aMBF1 (putative translation factor)